MKPKKKEISSKPSLTYHLGRACENVDCREPIADQERKSKRHCSEYTDENGIHYNCRRRKHHQKHQIHEDRLLDFAAIQRQTKTKIEDAVAKHGEYVTLEILDAYGIATNNYITISHGFQESTLEFLGFDIIMIPFKKSIKLQRHDKPTGMDDGRKIS
jgi:hypothetical protein